MSEYYKNKPEIIDVDDETFSKIEKVHHEIYDFTMPEDIMRHVSYFGSKCFDPDSPVLAFMAACHDYREGKDINGSGKEEEDKILWDSIVKTHFVSIRALLSDSMSFIKQMPDEEDWLDSTTKIIMSQCMYKSSITAYDLEHLIIHQVRNYMSTHPGLLLVHNVSEHLGAVKGINWYKKAQEEEDNEDMSSAMKDAIEEMEFQPVMDSIESETSIYGVFLSPSDKKWITLFAKFLAVGGGKINPKQVKDMALGIVIGRWTNTHPDIIVLKITTSDKHAFEVYRALMRKWIVNNSSSFQLAEKIYHNSIRPIEGKYPTEDVAELISAEMQLQGAK
jgi:hypothetical protein